MSSENTHTGDEAPESEEESLSRRSLIKTGAAATAGLFMLGAAPSPAQARETLRITPNPTGFFVPNLVRGDRDFKGHGPDIKVNARISVDNANELWARVSMYAKETTANWTTVSGSRRYKIWDGSNYGVERILRINSDTYTSDRYRDTDHGYETLTQRPGELVKQFRVRGDTKGNEAGTRTGVQVYFNPVSLTVRRAGVGTTTVTPDATGYFVPRNHTRGDRDFKGHGPFVYANARIGAYNTNELWAKVSMYARETTADWTTVSGSSWYKIWDGDDSRNDKKVREILDIQSDTYSSVWYRDTDHRDDRFEPGRGELVKQFRVRGDTKGDEAGTRTGVKVYFNPVRMKVRW